MNYAGMIMYIFAAVVAVGMGVFGEWLALFFLGCAIFCATRRTKEDRSDCE